MEEGEVRGYKGLRFQVIEKISGHRPSSLEVEERRGLVIACKGMLNFNKRKIRGRARGMSMLRKKRRETESKDKRWKRKEEERDGITGQEVEAEGRGERRNQGTRG